MASASEQILEEIVGHQIRLEGVSASILRKIMRLLDDAQDDILARILRRDVEGLSTKQLEALLKNIEAINANAAKELGKLLVEDLGSLAVYEAGYQAGLLQRFIPVAIQFVSNTPSRNQLIAAVQSRPFEGRLLREWIDQFDVNSANRIKAAVRLGVVEGQTTDQIVRRIRGTRAANYEDGVWHKTRRGAEALVRTATNHTANYARELTWAENDDMVKGVKWVSVLDKRTTLICASRDNKVYPLGKGPRPPAHINCRSTTTPVLKSWRELGFNIDDLPPGTRASMDGQVPADLSYGEWLKRRSREDVEEVLGKRKAKLFLDGGKPIEEFVRRDGHEYTLKELAKRDAAAFERANINTE